MIYKKIKSEFIRKKLKETSWKDREYIGHLMAIERAIIHGLGGWMDHYMYNIRKQSYRKEWEAIYKELKPKEFRNLLKQESREKEKEKKEEKKSRKRENKEYTKAKEEWKKMGGRIKDDRKPST